MEITFIGIFFFLLLSLLFLVNRNKPNNGPNSKRGQAAINRIIRTGVTDDTLKTINSQFRKR